MGKWSKIEGDAGRKERICEQKEKGNCRQSR